MSFWLSRRDRARRTWLYSATPSLYLALLLVLLLIALWTAIFH